MNSELTICRFTDKGLDEFRSYLSALRNGSTDPPPFHLLTDSKCSRPMNGDGTIQQRQFATRLDAAIYFDSALAGVEDDNIENDVYLWSWLSLFYFDQVCPVDKKGKRNPGRDYRHILEPGYRCGHRHLLGGAYLVCTIHGLGERLCRLLLNTPLSVESRFHHELAARQGLITNRGILESAHSLYLNDKTNKPKRGALMKNTPGTLFRFIHVIQQLDLNYDLYSMSGEVIIGLLPAEFDKWKK